MICIYKRMFDKHLCKLSFSKFFEINGIFVQAPLYKCKGCKFEILPIGIVQKFLVCDYDWCSSINNNIHKMPNRDNHNDFDLFDIMGEN